MAKIETLATQPRHSTQVEPLGDICLMKKILVVDDDPDVWKILGTFLRESGYAVFSASSAVEGLRVLAFHGLEALFP